MKFVPAKNRVLFERLRLIRRGETLCSSVQQFDDNNTVICQTDSELPR